MKKILIKQIKKKDLEEADKFQESILNPTNKKRFRTLNYIKRHYSKNPQFFMGAYQKNKLVGIIFAYVKLKNLLIGAFAVSENFRNKHVGTRLLQNIEKRAKKNKINKIVLGARKGIEPFYLRMGYKSLLFVQSKHALKRSSIEKYKIIKKVKGKFWIKSEYNSNILNKAKKDFRAYNAIFVFEKEL